MLNFNPMETKRFRFGTQLVMVHVQNDDVRHAWQLEVNGEKSPPTSYYLGILEFAGYAIATNYWAGTFEEFVPFQITYGTPELQSHGN